MLLITLSYNKGIFIEKLTEFAKISSHYIYFSRHKISLYCTCNIMDKITKIKDVRNIETCPEIKKKKFVIFLKITICFLLSRPFGLVNNLYSHIDGI